MKIIEEAICQTNYPEQFFSGNGQGIREAILRQAVKSCEHYATDVLIFFNSVELKELTEQESGEIWIWFRAMGVDWEARPAQYRYVMCLAVSGGYYTLTGEVGNV